jgi:hypothetical protein
MIRDQEIYLSACLNSIRSIEYKRQYFKWLVRYVMVGLSRLVQRNYSHMGRRGFPYGEMFGE